MLLRTRLANFCRHSLFKRDVQSVFHAAASPVRIKQTSVVTNVMAEHTSNAAVRWAVHTTLWTPSPAHFIATLALLLPPSDWPSVLRFSSQGDRIKAFVSRLMQRRLLHDTLGLGYENLCIERTPQGKPYLDLWLQANQPQSMRFPNLSFNVSHHGDYVVIVSDPVSPVGVDIITHDKHLDLHPEELFSLHATSFTRFEWKTIRSGGPDSCGMFDQFYRHWCMKEAYIKALGIGLGFELHRAEFHYHEDLIWGDVSYVYVDGIYEAGWQFFLHKLDSDHWVCVATGPPAVDASSALGIGLDIYDGNKMTHRDTSFTTLRTAVSEKTFSMGVVNFNKRQTHTIQQVLFLLSSHVQCPTDILDASFYLGIYLRLQESHNILEQYSNDGIVLKGH